jgi:hypothetical protein
MDFVKKNLIMLISAAVALLSLVLILLGMSKVSGVRTSMEESQQVLSNIDSLSRGVSVPTKEGGSLNLIPTEKIANKALDISAQQKTEGFKRLEVELKENIGFDPATGKIKRKVLLDGIFPKPVDAAQPYQFRTAYKTAIDDLLKKMQAGTVPTANELKASSEEVSQDLGFLADELMSEGKKGRTSKTTKKDVNTGYELSSEEQLKKLSIEIASDKRAAGIKVYCGINDLDVIANTYNPSGAPPAVEEMWWSQLSLWIQQDIADAVSKANADTKNVTDSVVKQLKINLVHKYYLPNGSIGTSENKDIPESFTGLKATNYYDVLRFSLETVVDARKIPEFINAMYSEGHYLLYSWKIEKVDPKNLDPSKSSQPSTEGFYRFGNAPIVKLTTYWEGYFLRDFYEWGIVGYDFNKKTNKPVLVFYNEKRQDVEDIENRENLNGLMPKVFRDALSKDKNSSSND